MTTQNLLVELFVEELPPKALNKLGNAFAGVLAEQLQAMGLSAADSQVTAFASPRRLAAHITHVALKAEDKAVTEAELLSLLEAARWAPSALDLDGHVPRDRDRQARVSRSDRSDTRRD